MINNTSTKRWDRVAAKSIDTQFSQAMQQGLNCSPFEAQIMVEKVHELYGPLFETSTTVSPGQVQTLVIDQQVRPGIPLRQAAQKLVTVTINTPEDLDTQKNQGIPALRQKRLCRVCEEAFQQGGLFTLEDLALLFNCGLRTLVGDLAVLRQKKISPPLRSTVTDIGRAVTHRRQIVSFWLQGLEYSDIARQAHHSVAAVANYVDKFKRCAALWVKGLDVATTAFLVRISLPLAQQFHELYLQAEAVPHRRQELQDFLKKRASGPTLVPPRRKS